LAPAAGASGRQSEESAEASQDQSTTEAESTAGDPELSRTLFSFFEPLLNIVGSFGVPLVIGGVIALVSGIIVVAFVSSMRLYGIIDIIIGVVIIAVVGLIFLSSVIAAFLSRTGRYGVNSLIMLGAFTGIALLIGIVTFENNKRFDLTATNQFSLASRTTQILSDLDQPIRATAFYKDIALTSDPSQANRRSKVEDTLQEFAARSSNFTFRVVDPDFKPDIANAYFGARPLAFVAEALVIEALDTDRFDVIQPTDDGYTQLEQDLVTGMLVATGEEQKAIYFLSGHGERSINSTGPDGYSLLREGLEQDNYLVQSLIWGPEDTDVAVPEDTALLVIGRPTGELPENHAAALHRYLQGKILASDETLTDRREGGRMIFLADVDTTDTFRQFLALWGVAVAPGYIRDLSQSVPGNPRILRVSSYNPEAPLEIVFPRGVPLQPTFMSSASPMVVVNDGLRRPVPLAITSPDSFLIADLEREDPITSGDQPDPPGPFSPAVFVQGIGPVGSPLPTAQPPDSELSWLVVFGDSDFVANNFFERGGGADLFLNSANYLLGDFSLVSIRDKAFTFREFNLNRNEFNFVRWTSWLFLPGLMGLMAALVWWVRR
jgi:ABC-type uncharacterized transport system involved in gliding motility auxiliary subunit